MEANAKNYQDNQTGDGKGEKDKGDEKGKKGQEKGKGKDKGKDKGKGKFKAKGKIEFTGNAASQTAPRATRRVEHSAPATPSILGGMSAAPGTPAIALSVAP